MIAGERKQTNKETKKQKNTINKENERCLVTGDWPTLAECEDGVGGGEVGGGDEVLRVGAVHLHPHGFLHAAMETGDLSRGEGDVDDVSLAVVSAKASTTQATLVYIFPEG